MTFSSIVWLAQGFGIGRVPFAPGTFGSILGLAWFAVSLSVRPIWVWTFANLLAISAAVWLSGAAEKALGRPDPGSIVIDEIVAVPICFVAWLLESVPSSGVTPPVATFFSGRALLWTIGVFAAFRLFDVAKPWPVGLSQRLPQGWGIVADDLLAAVWVNLIFLLARSWLK